METINFGPADRQPFSLRRTWIIALVIFAHGMLGMYLLAPAPPWKISTHPRSRARTHERGLIVVFLKDRSPSESRTRPSSPNMPIARHDATRTRRRHMQRAITSTRRHKAPASRVHAAPLQLTLPTSAPRDVPAYIAGGHAFRRRLQAAIRRNRRRLLPDHAVPGAPRFAMRDPRKHGLAHIMRTIFGARDPACIQAGTELAMSDKQRVARYIDRTQVQGTADHLHCEIRKSSVSAPAGPAIHMDASPPGHGTPPSGYGIN